MRPSYCEIVTYSLRMKVCLRVTGRETVWGDVVTICTRYTLLLLLLFVSRYPCVAIFSRIVQGGVVAKGLDHMAVHSASYCLIWCDKQTG